MVHLVYVRPAVEHLIKQLFYNYHLFRIFHGQKTDAEADDVGDEDQKNDGGEERRVEGEGDVYGVTQQGKAARS